MIKHMHIPPTKASFPKLIPIATSTASRIEKAKREFPMVGLK